MLHHKKHTFRERLYVAVLGFFLFALFLIPLPFMLIIERFFVAKDRSLFWRLVAHRICKTYFFLVRIKIVLPKDMPDPLETPTVFVSNHPTMIDGFLQFAFLGPHIIPLTAPAEMASFPFNIWFPKMGLIDVQRDSFDASNSTHANTKTEAIQKMIDTLTKQHNSVLIYPEGHIEKTHTMHYVHTGAARVALRAHAPIVVCTLIGMDKIILDKKHGRPGTVRVHFTKPIPAPKVSLQLPFRAAVKEYTERLQQTFIELLPSHNIPPYIRKMRKGIQPRQIGIFVDIDNTVYRGYSQKHFVRYLMKHKKISRFTMLRIFFYVMLEKMHLMEHKELMERALAFTKGWKPKDMEHVAATFFNEQVVPHLYHNMIPPIADHRKYGHTIVFVTEVIDPLAEQFKTYFKAADARGTVLEKKRGVYTGKILRLCKGEEKAEQVYDVAHKYKLDLTESYAYGDSLADIPMLNSVRYACAVRPHKKMTKKAEACHWEIIH